MSNILLADDDELLRDLVCMRLEARGHSVAVVSDGAAAIASVRAAEPALLILDSMMPVMSGPEVLQALKADPNTAHIPVIMLTARKSQEDVVTALRGGAADYLTKPFMPDELALRVASVLARTSSDDHRADSA